MSKSSTTNPHRKRRTRVFGPVVALFMGLASAAAICEVTLRWIDPQPTFSELDLQSPRCFKESTRMPWELLPGARTRHVTREYDTLVSINRQGLRMNRDVSREIPQDKKRILVIGDSFVFGWGVEAEESFPSRLEQLLQDQNHDVEVLNLGFAFGPAPPSYFVGLRESPPFDADIVVVAVFVGNDITTPRYVEWTHVDESGLPKTLSIDRIKVDALHRLRVSEPLLRYQAPVLRDSHFAIGLLRAFDRLVPQFSSSSKQTEFMILNPPALYHEVWPQWLVESFRKVGRSLIAIGELTKARGQQFLVVLIPHPQQLYRMAQTEDTGQIVGLARSNARSRDVPQQRLIRVLDKAGIATLDLLPPLLQANDLSLFFPVDQHFTPSGHQLAAATLAARLERQGALNP